MVALHDRPKRLLASTLQVLLLGGLLFGAVQTQLIAQEPIKIGFLIGFTGDYGPWGDENHKAALVAVKEMNDAGGPLGRPIELLSEDNQSSVEGGIQGYRKLVNVNDVVAVAGPESDIILALIDAAKEDAVPVVSHSAGTPSLDTTGGEFIFRTAPSDSLTGEVAANALLQDGYSRIAVLVENIEGAQTNAVKFRETYERLDGEIIDFVVYNPGQNTYQAELRRVYSGDPELLYVFGGVTSGATVLKQRFQRGYEGPVWVSTEMLSPDLIKAVGAEIADGIRGVVPVQNTALEAYQRFAARFEDMNRFPPGAGMYDQNAYDAMILLGLAIEAAGSTSSGKAINDALVKAANPPGVEVTTFVEGVKALRAGKDINYQGASGPVDFNQYGNVDSSFALMEVQGDSLEQIRFIPAGAY